MVETVILDLIAAPVILLVYWVMPPLAGFLILVLQPLGLLTVVILHEWEPIQSGPLCILITAIAVVGNAFLYGLAIPRISRRIWPR